MPQPKQKKATKVAIKRLIAGAVLRAIYICFRVADETNNNIIIAVTLDQIGRASCRERV